MLPNWIAQEWFHTARELIKHESYFTIKKSSLKCYKLNQHPIINVTCYRNENPRAAQYCNNASRSSGDAGEEDVDASSAVRRVRRYGYVC